MYVRSAKCTPLFNAQIVGSRSDSALSYGGTEEPVENTSVQLHEM